MASASSADVVVDDWRAGTPGQLGVPPGWEGQTWGKASALALSVVVEDGQRVLHLESRNDRATITRDLRGSVSLARTPILRWRWRSSRCPPAATRVGARPRTRPRRST